MRLSRQEKGFTLVELMIAVIVIGILASISVVSYIGVKERAREEKAKTNAATMKRVIDSFYSRNNHYPTTVTQLRQASISLPSDITPMSSANPTLDETTGERIVAYKYVPNTATPTGACIYYWSYTTKALSAVTRLGTATVGNCGTTGGLGSTPTP